MPESGLRKAIDYMLGLWVGLTRFLDDPRVLLTNNLAERERGRWSSAARTLWIQVPPRHRSGGHSL
jgi:Transposase IS66 family